MTAASHWQYSYDSDNRLKTATSTDLATAVTASLTYDAQGRLRQTQINRAGATPSNKTSNLLYDGVDLIAEYDTSTNAVQRRYVHGPGVDEPLVWYEGSGTGATANKNWLYADHLGSIIATANASGSASAGSGTVNTYGPFGESAQTTPDNNRFGYTGQQQLKGLGLYYYKARIYSPALGRFLQTDPIGVADDLNLYSYVGGNPVNGTDPSGTDAISALLKFGGRLGSKETRDHVAQVAQEWVDKGWRLVSGGGGKEDLIKNVNGGSKGGAYGDIALKNEVTGQTKIINTADTYANGTYTAREIANGQRIQSLRPEADFSMVAKPKSQRGGATLEFLFDLLTPLVGDNYLGRLTTTMLAG